MLSVYRLYDWTSAGTAEVDFLIEKEGVVIPIEMKAREHTKSRRLSVFSERYRPRRRIRFSERSFGWENGIDAIPLYAAWLALKARKESPLTSRPESHMISI